MSKKLRDYSVSSAVSTSLTMISGKNKRRTVVVEGVNDVRFFNQWYGDSNKVRFVSVGGKDKVKSTYDSFLKNPRAKSLRCMFFCVDIDWDFLHGKKMPDTNFFMANSFCLNNNVFYHNDMECFLLNTVAIKKVLASYDYNMEDNALEDLLVKMESASRAIGKYRAADEVVRRKFGLYSSVLNGLNELSYFDCSNFSIDEVRLQSDMPQWSNYAEHVDDLIEEANALDQANPTPWALTHGHDVTSMLSEYLKCTHGVTGLHRDKLEKELRLSCELADFHSTPMYKKLSLESLC
ncbi:TPA: DUF4435 domain-containing protein [Klebsiella pneumoniae]